MICLEFHNITLSPMKTLIALLLCSAPLCLAGTTRDQGVDTPSADHPADHWEAVFESGYLWNIGNNTAIDYEIAPTQLTFRSPTVLDWFAGEDGSRLIVRSRFSILGESIVEGPEDYYFGINGAPSIEYWFPDEKTSIFFLSLIHI